MRRRGFARLVASLDGLNGTQLRQLRDTVAALARRGAVQALAATRISDGGGCPRCGSRQYTRWGATDTASSATGARAAEVRSRPLPARRCAELTGRNCCSNTRPACATG